jgi:hypothetical protein
MVRWPFRRHSSIGRIARKNRRRGAILILSSKVADHRRIRGGNKERGTAGDKQMGRNATGRANRNLSRDLSLDIEADLLLETVDGSRCLHS